jgi:alpha-tubulin suppressor-like RCC1 family protein
MVLWGVMAPSACKVFDPSLVGDGQGSMTDAAELCEDTQSDPNNCGACGDVCTFAHASGECAAGECANTCEAGWKDCDDEHLNGCEANLTSKRSCSDCGLTCGFACNAESCVTGVGLTGGSTWTCVTLDDGAARCWGSNTTGQLGTGTQEGTPVPVNVKNMDKAQRLVAGFGHTCALMTGRVASCWGQNDVGQLGDHTTTLHPEPIPVQLSNIDGIAVGLAHTCARSGQILYCWGFNDAGQLGFGNEDAVRDPRMLETTSTGSVFDVSAGLAHTCIIQTGGSVLCWGYNDQGQSGSPSLADGGANEILSPEPVPGITDAATISLGHAHSCVVTNGGTVRCWGWNQAGQLGNGGFDHRFQPDVVRDQTNAVLTGIGKVVGGPDRTCAITTDNATAYCWGSNPVGALGAGLESAQESRAVKVTVTGTQQILDIAVGLRHTCFLTNVGITCVGDNKEGQLGDGTTVSTASGVDVSL